MNEQTSFTGRRFGRWLVVGEGVSAQRAVLCKCDCGTVRSVLLQNLKNGGSKSCGCFKREKNSRVMREFWAAGRNRYGELK